MSVKTVGVVGGGTMGAGIAQVFAVSGQEVILQDIADGALDAARARIRKSLDRFVAKGKVEAPAAEAAMNRLTCAGDLDAVASCDFVVEAGAENVGIKKDIFAHLDRICRPGVILGSNTSSISITVLAAATSRPEHVIGMRIRLDTKPG